MPKVSVEILNRVVLRLANSGPVRYWMDGTHDGKFSHYKLSIWSPWQLSAPMQLIKELAELGFEYQFNDTRSEGPCNIYTFLAEREEEVPL